MAKFVGLVLGTCLPWTVDATKFLVRSFEQLSQAVATPLADGDEIEIASDIRMADRITVTGPVGRLSMYSTPGQHYTISNGTASFGAQYFKLTSVNLTLSNLTFSNADTTGGKGTDRNGAVIYGSGIGLQLERCNFIDNYSADQAAGVYVFGQSFVTATSCNFTRNVASKRGGAIYLVDSTFVGVDIKLRENSDARYSGDIFVGNSEITCFSSGGPSTYQACPYVAVGTTSGSACRANCEGEHYPCAAGTYSAANRGLTWAGGSDDASPCSICPGGTSTLGQDGASKCSTCSAGKFASKNLTADTSGMGLNLAAQVCAGCPMGMYQDRPGEYQCKSCTAPRWTNTSGRASCNACDEGHYLDDNGLCTECPNHVNCSSKGGVSLASLKVDPGYFRFSTDTAVVHSCSIVGVLKPSFCAGGAAAESCTASSLTTGPLCAVCKSGSFRSVDECRSCRHAATSPAFLVFCALAFILLVLVCIARRIQGKMDLIEQLLTGNEHAVAERLSGWELSRRLSRGWLSRRLSSPQRQAGGQAKAVSFGADRVEEGNAGCEEGGGAEDDPTNDDDGEKMEVTKKEEHEERKSAYEAIKPKIAILIAFAQLVASSSFNLGVSYPRDFAVFLSAIDVVNFSAFHVFPLECFVRSNFYSNLLAITLAPLAVSAGLVGWHVLYRRRQTDPARVLKHRKLLFSIFLALADIVLPTASSTIFRTFRCEKFEDVNSSYLVSDYSIACVKDGEVSSTRIFWLIYASVSMLIYTFGIPTMFAVLLWRERFTLCPELENHSLGFLFIQTEAWQEIDKAPSPQGAKESIVSFLADAYKPRAFWFGVIECYRRLMLSSMLILVAAGSIAQSVTAVLICLFCIKFYGYYQPFDAGEDGVLAEAAQFCLFFVFFVALLIQADAAGESKRDQLILSVLLIVAASFVFIAFLGAIAYSVLSVTHGQQKTRAIVRRLTALPARAGGQNNRKIDRQIEMTTAASRQEHGQVRLSTSTSSSDQLPSADSFSVNPMFDASSKEVIASGTDDQEEGASDDWERESQHRPSGVWAQTVPLVVAAEEEEDAGVDQNESSEASGVIASGTDQDDQEEGASDDGECESQHRSSGVWAQTMPLVVAAEEEEEKEEEDAAGN